MKYVIDFGPDVMNIQLDGAFTFQDAETFRRLMTFLQEEHQREQIHLNVAKLGFVDATGVSLFLNIHDLAKKLHLKLVFVHPKGQVYEALTHAAQFNLLHITA
ncbi:MAG: STAS domain-containing protein [Proteobacteria bacterium]|jgi:anti-anti-sigma factor|nr:STAS domain-containing protein [Alphaproteobacteria bacterium]NCC03013.1 STAS domain-containing protein [Pseudomonadota bacterium]